MNFLGDCSHYVELPKPDEIYDYERYTSADYLLENDIVEKELDKIDSSNSDFNFVL